MWWGGSVYNSHGMFCYTLTTHTHNTHSHTHTQHSHTRPHTLTMIDKELHKCQQQSAMQQRLLSKPGVELPHSGEHSVGKRATHRTEDVQCQDTLIQTLGCGMKQVFGVWCLVCPADICMELTAAMRSSSTAFAGSGV